MLPGAVLLVQQARFLAAIPLVNGNASRVPLQNLTQPLPTKDGGVLRTIGEAVAYMASPPEEETRSQWQLAADAILKQAAIMAGLAGLALQGAVLVMRQSFGELRHLHPVAAE